MSRIIREFLIAIGALLFLSIGSYFVRAGAMSDRTFGTLVVTASLLLVLFFAMRKPPGPRKPPQHPLPAHELLDFFVRIKRRRADFWNE